MIRNAVIHFEGDQPLQADLMALPTAADASVICTNMRTLDGKRPTFVDALTSTFVIPLVHIRFIEIAADDRVTSAAPALPEGEPETEEAAAELDEDFLRRIREA